MPIVPASDSFTAIDLLRPDHPPRGNGDAATAPKIEEPKQCDNLLAGGRRGLCNI
jgi:hypothetical protein